MAPAAAAVPGRHVPGACTRLKGSQGWRCCSCLRLGQCGMATVCGSSPTLSLYFVRQSWDAKLVSFSGCPTYRTAQAVVGMHLPALLKHNLHHPDGSVLSQGWLSALLHCMRTSPAQAQGWPLQTLKRRPFATIACLVELPSVHLHLYSRLVLPCTVKRIP